MDSQYIVLSELLSDQAAFITSPKTSLANYWRALPSLPPPPSVYRPAQNIGYALNNTFYVRAQDTLTDSNTLPGKGDTDTT